MRDMCSSSHVALHRSGRNGRRLGVARLLAATAVVGALQLLVLPLGSSFTGGVGPWHRRSASRGAMLARAADEGDSSLQIKTEVRGKEGTADFRRFFLDAAGREISPWHDLPLKSEGEYVMVTEIPQMTKPKMEIATKEPSNPIAQDVKKGKLRDYHGPIFWNYGYLPQTWEDPTEEHPELKVFGDDDPVDVVEIGSRAQAQGEVTKVKVLGALAMIDDGELDWKVIAIASDDALAGELNDIEDVDARMPGVISGIREWFRWYKTPDGKPLNQFGFDEAPLNAKETQKVIEETHEAWQRLRRGEVESKLWAGEAEAQA